MFTLVIGNKNLSSWSLRPWLVLKMLQEPFEEKTIDLTAPDAAERIRAINPAGKVPLLIDRGLKVWDSLAICEYLAECFPQAGLWPHDSAARAQARAMVAEMHAGMNALREQMPMDIVARHPTPALTGALARDVARIESLWSERREVHQADGPFLFGRFTIADAYYAPVATRFATYRLTLNEPAQAYAEHLLALEPMQAWIAAAEAEAGALACRG